MAQEMALFHKSTCFSDIRWKNKRQILKASIINMTYVLFVCTHQTYLYLNTGYINVYIHTQLK